MSYISTTRVRDEVLVWERNENGRELKRFQAPYYFYTRAKDGPYQSIYGDRLERHDFEIAPSFQDARTQCKAKGIEMFESDIPCEQRILSENYYNVPAPTLHITFFDIEVDYSPEIGFASANNPYAPINSVALYHQHTNEYVVIAVPPEGQESLTVEQLTEQMEQYIPLPENTSVHLVNSERDLLIEFLYQIEDSDVISGWNSDVFDVPYIGRRLEKLGNSFFQKLSFPGGSKPSWRDQEIMNQTFKMLDLCGRISADYMVIFRKYEVSDRQSFKLESVAEDFLPDLPKIQYSGSLASLYKNDFALFVRYNIRDTEILHGLENMLGYIDLANKMYHLSTGEWKHVTGTLKLAEQAMYNYCKYELGGLVLPDNHTDDLKNEKIQGAYVLEPKVGLHEYLGSVDINSLYPSTIRTINISPETLVGQFVLTTKAVDMIYNQDPSTLVLEYDSGEQEEHPANEWADILWKRKWSISGYGTVFSQQSSGIIPDILSMWYRTRKEYQGYQKQAAQEGNKTKETYYDKLQYVYKIKLNSFYGALTNQYFRFYDLRLGESVTSTGRLILRHQCAKANEFLTGEYDTTGDAVIYGDSVAGDTKIYTNRGTFNIKDLFTETNFSSSNGKEYCDAHKLEALTYNPKTGNNEFRRLKYVMRHKVNKSMYRVWFGNTRYIDVTEDHSLIGYANTKHKTPGLVEVKPTDIGKEHINGILLNRHIPRERTISTEISDEMFTLMGLIVGDGHVEKNIESGVGLSIGNNDKQEIFNKVIDPLIIQQWFTSCIDMKNGHDVRLCGTKGWYFLKECLYSKGTKTIPEWLYDCDEQKICAFLRGYFTADGFANKNGTVGLSSTTLDNIIHVNNLLKLSGIPSNYWTENTENSYKGKYSGTYTVRLTVYDAVDFGNKIGFVLDRKNKNIKTEYGRPTKHLTTQTGYCVVHPTKIEQIPIPEYVYDIEVDETHTFYANDILVHNTDSTYFETWTEDIETSIKVANRVAEGVTKSFSDFIESTFMCQPQFNDIIKAGREIVSDRGIFVDKKRYILHVVDDEGKRVDKLKVMGLDTKKTTLPKPIADQLNKFVERYLKGESWETIANDIVDYKDSLRNNENVTTIGLPKGIKNLEHYTEQYNIYGDGARLPGHVAAAIFYNICRDYFNDKESMPINSGMKIKVFYLSKKVGRFKNVAIPVDIEQVPTWFTKNFTIDKDAHIERLVDKPLSNIIKAIDKEVPTRQTLMNEELFEF